MKRLLALVLAVIMLTTAAVAANPTIHDALDVLKTLAGLSSPVNRDDVTIHDALEILKFLAGIKSEYDKPATTAATTEATTTPPVTTTTEVTTEPNRPRGEIDFRVLGYERISSIGKMDTQVEILLAQSLNDLENVLNMYLNDGEEVPYLQMVRNEVLLKMPVIDDSFFDEHLIIIIHHGLSDYAGIPFVNSLVKEEKFLTVNTTTGHLCIYGATNSGYRIVLSIKRSDLINADKVEFASNTVRFNFCEAFCGYIIGECTKSRDNQLENWLKTKKYN